MVSYSSVLNFGGQDDLEASLGTSAVSNSWQCHSPIFYSSYLLRLAPDVLPPVRIAVGAGLSSAVPN